MSISPVKGVWWKPADREERIWIAIALVWCIFITLMMPIWEFTGKQNPPNESYKIQPEEFMQLANEFTEKYQVGVEKGIPVVEPPPGADVYLVGRMWMWEPILKLKKGETYRVHLSSVDLQHGLSIYPLNMNFMALPGYDYVLTLTPTEAGDYRLICNEFCGIGHHNMVGKLIVTE